MKQYHFVEDLTSDVMFEAYGTTLEEMFEASAEALFSLICDSDKINQKASLNIEVTAENIKNLLYEFLSSLLTESEIKGLFLNRFTIKKLKQKTDGFYLKVKAEGEKMTPEKGGTVVKGITYYRFQCEKTVDGYRAQVAMDI